MQDIYIFEGIDNVGKTTVIQRLKEKIDMLTEYNCISLAFPGNEPSTLGSLVYDIHHHQKKYFDSPVNQTSLQLLHIASHIDLIQRRLLNFKSPCGIILLDRFWWSTYAYGLAGELDEDIVKAIISPELLYWKNIDIKRVFLLERENRERDYEIEKDTKIVNIYRELARKEQKCRIFNNDGSIEELVSTIYNEILENSTHGV